MTIKIVPLPTPQGLKFDIITQDGYVKSIEMDDYEVRQFRGATIADIIEHKVLDFLHQAGYTVDTVTIVYC